MGSIRASLAAAVLAAAALASTASAQTAPRPQPPRGVLPPGSTPSAPPATQAPAPAPTPAAQAPAPPASAAKADVATTGPSEASLGAPVYPGSTYLGSFDAGQGQRFYLYGTSAAYLQVVNYYRTVLKTRGEEVFDMPPVWTFDTGRFREQTMAYAPGVTVRDHMAGGARGYLHAEGAREQRYPTVIQVVPPAPGDRK